ncbi:copper resistance CopC family protein [Dyella halodurans]|uniref:Copper resistance protein CopC n=1 Tax=Dyella halodurans TaxID=1920171 RepID=A0ABV9C3N2_9GAMM|nr:copper resistance CopC family protein [Dyella halodurans]
MGYQRRFAIVVLTLAGMFMSISASAHAILVDSTPKANGSMAAGHAALVLKYNSKIDQGRSRLVLVGPDHKETPLAISASADRPNELDSSAELSPGAYVIHWQALALDGHITRGDLPFTVSAKP